MKTIKEHKLHPFERILEWSVVNRGITLMINASFINLKGGESLDVEDDEKGNFVGLGIYCPVTRTCFYWSEWQKAKLLNLKPFIAHNGMSDITKLQNWGFKVDKSFLMWDTQLMAHILDSSRKNYGLKNLVKQDLGIEYPSYEEVCGKKTSKDHKTLNQFPEEAVAEYNAMDCYTTYKLYEKQEENFIGVGINPNQYYFDRIEKPSAQIFKSMEERGIRIDLDYLKELKEHLEEQKEPVEKQIKNELGDINLNSPKQLLGALHAKEIYPEFKGKPSTDKRALERLRASSTVQSLLQYSEFETLLSSFVNPYLERKQEVVHPYFNQCGTRTGRPSCSNPNLLQIPKRTENGKLVRKMFIAREGYLLGDCDFGQIEPRLLAHMSGDKALSSLFSRGIDFHDYTAQKLNIDREKAKILNLSVGYRATFKSVSQQLKCSEREAQNEIDMWWGMFPELRQWQDKLIWQTKKDGYCTTLFGRRIKIDGLNEYNTWKRESAQRQLFNNICQGSAAEVMKRAMIEVSKLNLVDILVQIYDELLFEFEQHQEIHGILFQIEKAMTSCVKLDVPLVVEAKSGLNWAEVA